MIPTLWDEPVTEPCRYGCPGKALLGLECYNATHTCMNQTSTCQRCGREAIVSRNLTLAKKAKAA